MPNYKTVFCYFHLLVHYKSVYLSKSFKYSLSPLSIFASSTQSILPISIIAYFFLFSSKSGYLVLLCSAENLISFRTFVSSCSLSLSSTIASPLPGSLTANYSLYKPQPLIKTGFQSYFFVNSYVIFCSYL